MNELMPNCEPMPSTVPGIAGDDGDLDDVLYYAAILAAQMGVSLEEVMQRNFRPTHHNCSCIRLSSREAGE